MYNISLTMATEVEVRKIGNSLGVLLPKEFVKKSNIKPKEKILIEIFKKADLSKFFGMIKRKMSDREFKEMVKSGWD